MDFLQAVVLGIVQGLTEFAPVSSSAHLVLVPWLLGWPEPSLLFDTVLHLGTLVAVVAVLWREIWIVLRDWFKSLMPGNGSTKYSRLGWLIIIGTIPGAVLGYLFKDIFEELFGAPIIVGVFLVCTAVFLTLAEKIGNKERTAEQLSTFNSLLVGIGQAIAIAPGVSRSGATMSTARLLGLSRAESARFSFLLSVPIILGAAASQLRGLAKATASASTTASTLNASGHISDNIAVLVGFLAAVISGYLCISFLLNYLRRRSFYPFAIYCLVVGIGIVAIGLLGIR